MLPYPIPDTIGTRAATGFSASQSPTTGDRPPRGVGIGMELLKPGAGWTCGRFDATQSRLVAVISGTQGEGGRAERCVIVTGYLRTKFFETAGRLKRYPSCTQNILARLEGGHLH